MRRVQNYVNANKDRVNIGRKSRTNDALCAVYAWAYSVVYTMVHKKVPPFCFE